MNIFILHRVPYERIDYARGIDHAAHAVTYFGLPALLDGLPPGLPCTRVARTGEQPVFDEARAWLQRQPTRPDRVLSLSEYELLDAARLREWGGIPGPSHDEVLLVRDKVRMKRAVQRAGLRVPPFLPLPELLADPGRAPWRGTTVLKPHSGASSEDVVVFASPVQLCRAVAAGSSGAQGLDSGKLGSECYQVEAFVGGEILHFDGLVADGQLLTITASRYVGTCLGFAQGEPLGSYHFPITPIARRWAARALAAVDIRHGSFHLEAIDDGSGLVFLEVGNRVGGADVVPAFELATGVHLPSEELRILLEGAPSRPLPPTQTGGAWHGWFVFPGHRQRADAFEGIAGIDAFRDDPAVIRWAELARGQPLQRRITYSANEAPLAGIVAHGDWRRTRHWLEALFAAARGTASAAPVAAPTCVQLA